MNMFIGEMCCIFVYLFLYRRQTRKYGTQLSPKEKEAVSKGLKIRYSPLWFGIPGCFDVFASTMMYMALVSIDASVMQIISCTTLVWVGVFSFIFLKRRYTIQQYVGMAILVFGVVIVAVGSMLTAKGNGSQNSPFGIIMMILSVVFVGIVMVSEEKLLSVYYAHPLQIVGIEGATGLTIYCILLVILYYIPCTPNTNTSFCPYGRLEDTPKAIMEIGTNYMLLIAAICTVTSLGFFNFFGVSLTKYASATHRGVINAVRPCSVWIISLALDWEKFAIHLLIGYFVAVYGMLLYYSIIPLNLRNLCRPKNETGRDLEETTLNE
jgi:drug/metabolite transporter (DMT)-like permease